MITRKNKLTIFLLVAAILVLFVSSAFARRSYSARTTIAANFNTLITYLTVACTDQSIGKIKKWYWDFGDGTNSTQQNPMHTYNAAGSYKITLKVSQNLWVSDSTSKVVEVTSPPVSSAPPPPSPPVASFTVSPSIGEVPLTVNFTDKSTNAKGWLWNFGDGATDNTENPTHVYRVAGTFTPKLTVTADGGQDSTTGPTIDVVATTLASSDPPPSPPPPSPSGPTYYIAPNGSDSNPGILAAPWAITALSRTDKFGPGDTVIVEDGTYTYSGSQDSMFITINKSGTASSPIVIKSQNKWGAVLDGNKLAHSVINVGAYVSYVTIDGFDIRNGRWGGIWENNGAGGTPNEAAHHITISHNNIHDIGRRLEYDSFNGICGIFTGVAAHDFTIDGNLIHDIGRLNPETTGAIISKDPTDAENGYPGTPPAGYYWTSAVHNWTHDHAYYDSSYLNNNMYNNVVYNANHGWIMYTGGNNKDINNTFLGPPNPVQAGAVWVGSYVGGIHASDTGIISNNVIMDGGLDTAICFWDPSDVSGYTVRNNIYNTSNLVGAEFGGPGLKPFDFSSLNQSGNSAPNTDPGLMGKGKPYETVDQVGYDGRHYSVLHVNPANVNPTPASSASPTVNKAYRGDLPAVDYYSSSRPLPASSNGDIGAVELNE